MPGWNLPCGVTGAEPEIAGYPWEGAYERWLEDVHRELAGMGHPEIESDYWDSDNLKAFKDGRSAYEYAESLIDELEESE